MAERRLLLGAVAYDPNVVPIWEGMRDYFVDRGVPFDFALFSNYERQVEQLLGGHIDVAWNTPLAHVRVQRRTDGRSLSLGMRDSDRDFHAKVVVRRDAGIRDSKEMSDGSILRAAVAVRKLPHAVRVLTPPEYNARHEAEKNVALFLATLHAEAVAEALRGAAATRVVIDQFTFAERLEEALRRAGVRLPVEMFERRILNA